VINEEKFDKIYTEEVAAISDHSLTIRANVEETVDNLIQAINKAIDSSTLWARLSEQAKLWWTPEYQEAVRVTRTLRNRFTRE
jgi:hypothetical protein